jgi:Ca2+-binding RTX toxin-like protein
MAVINASPYSIVTLGTSEDDTINGTDNNFFGRDAILASGGNDLVYGNSQNDSISGGTGNDTLDGGTGNDTLEGGTGNDIFYVDSVSDVVTEDVNEGTDTIYTSAADGPVYALPNNVENLILLDGASSYGIGNSLSNEISGNNANNFIVGGDGNDILTGRGGNDTLYGGAGDDYITEATSFGSYSNYIDGGDDNDTLIGIYGSDIIKGGSGNDGLVFGLGSHTVNGDAGDDTLISGGSSNSTLTGGLGADTFEFFSYYFGGSSDTITDFKYYEGDKIKIFVTDKNVQISNFAYEQSSGKLMFYGNGSPTLVATLQSNLGTNFIPSYDIVLGISG